MYAQLPVLDLDARSVSQHVRIMPVASEADLEGWLDVASACAWFETPRERDAFKRLGLELVLSPSHEFYLASSGEPALGMASAFYTGELALLTSIAVLPAARRQGIARALALSRLRIACERGCRSAVLAPSPDGAGLYRAIGFEAPSPATGRSRRRPRTQGWPPDRVVVELVRAALRVMIAGDVLSEAGGDDVATLDRARSTAGRAVVR